MNNHMMNSFDHNHSMERSNSKPPPPKELTEREKILVANLTNPKRRLNKFCPCCVGDKPNPNHHHN